MELFGFEVEAQTPAAEDLAHDAGRRFSASWQRSAASTLLSGFVGRGVST